MRITRELMAYQVKEALATENSKKILEAENWLRSFCLVKRISMIEFLRDEIFSTKVVEKTEVLVGYVHRGQVSTCPYCQKSFENGHGLKAHVSVKHREKFEEWKNLLKTVKN